MNYSQNSIRRINLLEIGLVVFSLILLCSVFYWGFYSQTLVNKDRQKNYDITQVILPALFDFYKNSASTENQRFYPKAQCSGDLNEVDYELSLRQYLTGQKPEVEIHEYIPNNLFPRDRNGFYSQTLDTRKVPYRCPNLLTGFNNNQNKLDIQTYTNFPSCNFRSSNFLIDQSGRRKTVPRYLNCYLYTSSNTGDSFRLGYFSQARKCFVIYQRYRSLDLQSSLECNF